MPGNVWFKTWLLIWLGWIERCWHSSEIWMQDSLWATLYNPSKFVWSYMLKLYLQTWLVQALWRACNTRALSVCKKTTWFCPKTMKRRCPNSWQGQLQKNIRALRHWFFWFSPTISRYQNPKKKQSMSQVPSLHFGERSQNHTKALQQLRNRCGWNKFCGKT